MSRTAAAIRIDFCAFQYHARATFNAEASYRRKWPDNRRYCSNKAVYAGGGGGTRWSTVHTTEDGLGSGTSGLARWDLHGEKSRTYNECHSTGRRDDARHAVLAQPNATTSLKGRKPRIVSTVAVGAHHRVSPRIHCDRPTHARACATHNTARTLGKVVKRQSRSGHRHYVYNVSPPQRCCMVLDSNQQPAEAGRGC